MEPNHWRKKGDPVGSPIFLSSVLGSCESMKVSAVFSEAQVQRKHGAALLIARISQSPFQIAFPIRGTHALPG
jgi:hypothetical protein